ncbi:hypothetical protein [Methylosinus sp. H3A]|uniref:hypothetical protein n=1 Tax=Methylosinus sp. H3A TaxID=2785786 RepID=UPI001AEEE0A4|nr:hypothetical protein [Methylosinus sp. H3A]
MTEAHVEMVTAMIDFPGWSRHRLAWRYGLALVAITFFAFLPLLSLFAASLVASANSCALDEGNPHPCLILGSDVGQTLYNMAVGGWLMIFTLPIGAGLFVLWLLVLVVHSWRRRKRPSFD